MAGVAVSGVLWAIFQNNAGGAWDNAKKSFEAGVEINGKIEKKGSEAHKAAVTGDTVGDPFKDTSGPSMNILIKLTCLVGLVIAPILGDHGAEDVSLYDLDKNIEKNVILDINDENPNKSSLTIVTKSEINGVVSEVTEKCYGSRADLLLKVADISGEPEIVDAYGDLDIRVSN
jgi:K(+)-stimulated pyrophosphate-energized sodium pump